MMTASLDVVHKVCIRCGATAGLTVPEIAAGYKCLRCGGFYKDFTPLEGTREGMEL